MKQRLSATFEFAALKDQISADPPSLTRRDFARRPKIARKAAQPAIGRQGDVLFGHSETARP